MYNLPDDCHLSISRVVSNEEVYQNKNDVKELVLYRMHEELKDFILRKRLTEQGLCFGTVYRLDVIVLDPDEFARIVHDEARRLMTVMNANAVKG